MEKRSKNKRIPALQSCSNTQPVQMECPNLTQTRVCSWGYNKAHLLSKQSHPELQLHPGNWSTHLPHRAHPHSLFEEETITVVNGFLWHSVYFPRNGLIISKPSPKQVYLE